MEDHLPVTQICLQVGDIQELPWIAGHGVTHHWVFHWDSLLMGLGNSLPGHVNIGAHQPKLLLQQLIPFSHGPKNHLPKEKNAKVAKGHEWFGI